MEDMGTMRMMPNMTVIAPGDPLQLVQFIRLAYEVPGPVYIRLGRGNDPVVHDENQKIEIGTAITVRDGGDLTIIACGTIVSEAIAAGRILAELGINTRVIDMHTIKPLDVETVLRAAEETRTIITAENHSIIGGLGLAVAEVLATAGIPCRLKRLGVPDVFGLVGEPEDLFHHYGLGADGIRAAALALLG
jgi:transketolase